MVVMKIYTTHKIIKDRTQSIRHVVVVFAALCAAGKRLFSSPEPTTAPGHTQPVSLLFNGCQ